MKKLSVLFAALLLAGCSIQPIKTPPNKMQFGAMLADSATTYVAMSDGATELNPLFANMSPVNAAVSNFAFSYGMSHLFPEGRQLSCAFKWGAVANNIGVIAGASAGVSIGLAFIGGFASYESCAD